MFLVVAGYMAAGVESKQRINGVAVIAVSSLFFGLMAVMTRLLSGEVPAAQVAAIRFAVGIVSLLLSFVRVTFPAKQCDGRKRTQPVGDYSKSRTGC